MVVHSINAAIASKAFTHILVSTDDEELAQIAKTNGADVPFLRPAELCDDYTPLLPVIRNALQTAETHYQSTFDFVCCLYATAPMVSANDIADGLKRLQEKPEANYALSICAFSFPIFRSVKLKSDGYMQMFWPEHEKTRSQDLEMAWHDAAQFIWGRKQAWFSAESIFNNRAIGIPIPTYRVQDIDTPEDWKRAEALWRANKEMDEQ